jgi:hypothetical protein
VSSQLVGFGRLGCYGRFFRHVSDNAEEGQKSPSTFCRAGQRIPQRQCWLQSREEGDRVR